MVTYRVFYRTASTVDDNGVDRNNPGPWVAWDQDIIVSSLPTSFTVTNLSNAVEYELVVGEVVNGSFSERSNFRRATPVPGTAQYDALGTHTINAGGLTSFTRQALNTTLTMSNATWLYVLLDYGSERVGVTNQPNQTNPLPDNYDRNSNRLVRTGPLAVEIKLASTEAFTFRVVDKSTSITIALSAVTTSA
jgi:hypothetical protein